MNIVENPCWEVYIQFYEVYFQMQMGKLSRGYFSQRRTNAAFAKLGICAYGP